MDFMDSFNSQIAETNKARRDMADKKRVNIQPPRAPRAPLEYRLPTSSAYRRPLWF